MTKSIEHDIFDFEAIPMGQSRHIGTDEYGFSTALRVPGGWIIRLHGLRGNEMA
ncbi:hypothetical protein KQI65_07120 [bacterium]|nr:hypothetical protein [bacterium]